MNFQTDFVIPDWVLAVIIFFKICVSLWEWRSTRKDYLIGFLCVPLGWLLLYYLLSAFLSNQMTLDDRMAIFRPGFALLMIMNTLIIINGEVNCRIAGVLAWLRRTRRAAAARFGSRIAGLVSWIPKLKS